TAEAEIETLGAGGRSPAHQRLLHRGRRDPHVAPDRHPPRLELLDVGAPDRLRARLVELVGIDPAHVVRLEGLGIEHPPRCYAGASSTSPINRVEAASGDSLITVAGRPKRLSASASA